MLILSMDKTETYEEVCFKGNDKTDQTCYKRKWSHLEYLSVALSVNLMDKWGQARQNVAITTKVSIIKTYKIP